MTDRKTQSETRRGLRLVGQPTSFSLHPSTPPCPFGCIIARSWGTGSDSSSEASPRVGVGDETAEWMNRERKRKIIICEIVAGGLWTLNETMVSGAVCSKVYR